MRKLPIAGLKRYSAATAYVALATALRLLLNPLIGDQFPFATLFFAVAASAWYGGFGPAVAAALLGAAASALFFLPPLASLAVSDPVHQVGLLLYMAVSGAMALLGGSMHDARRKAEEAAADAARRREELRMTLASIGDGVITTDARGRVAFVNDVAQALTGWTQGEAEGAPLETVFAIVNEASRKPVENPALRALEDGVIVGLANHTLLIAKDGTERPIDDSAAPVRDADGKVVGSVLVFRDVTERRRADAAMREQDRRLRAVLESVTDAFFNLDRGWRFTYVNGQAEALLGRRRDELLGRNHWEEYPDTLGTTVEENYRKALDAGVMVSFENFYAPHRRWYEVRAYPSADGLAVYFRDVSARKTTEIELRESERRFRMLADAMPQIVWTATREGNIDFLNRRWTEFTGEPQTVGNEGWGPILHPDDSSEAFRRWAASVESGTPFEMEIRLLDRRRQAFRWHLMRTVAVRNEAGDIARWYGTATDINDQKQAEEASRYLAEASAALARVTDYASTLQKVANLAVPHFADWSAVDVADERGGLRRLAVAHQDAAKVALVHELMRDYPPDPEAPSGAHVVLRTGKPEFIAEITDEMLVQGARDEQHLGLIRSLGLRSYICVPLIVSGKALGVLTFATAESGRTYDHADLALATDLARRASIAVENTQLYQALREADRRKDEFLATLAHELRNPLAPIRNSLQVLKMPRVDAGMAEKTREIIERQVHQLVRLVDDLLDVSRVMRGKIDLRRERVELASVIARAVETAQPHIDAQGQRLEVSVPPESLPLDADAVRLAQVLGNLLTNAAKYTEPNGRIWLTARREGDEALLTVRDNGIGIVPDMLPHVFELFVQADHATTKTQGGLGIGLTLVKNLVEMHGGSVTAYSEGLGRGSQFTLRLPLATQVQLRPEQEGNGERQEESRQPGQRLLVVDDNHDAAESLAMLLQLQGHEVKIANDGQSALEVAESFRPHLVFLDIGMPGMDGYEVARRLRRTPGLEATSLAALTGWGQQADRRRTAEAGFDHHLVKPPEPGEVEKVVAELERTEFG
jgi:PAS domain S-box-containing protein